MINILTWSRRYHPTGSIAIVNNSKETTYNKCYFHLYGRYKHKFWFYSRSVAWMLLKLCPKKVEPLFIYFLNSVNKFQTCILIIDVNKKVMCEITKIRQFPTFFFTIYYTFWSNQKNPRILTYLSVYVRNIYVNKTNINLLAFFPWNVSWMV